jgi:hypothetical protein
MASQAYHEPEIAPGGADFRVDPYLVIVTIEPLTSAAKTWIEENTEPWQWQDDRLCVEHAFAADILCRIAQSGLSYEGTCIEIPDEHSAAERLLKEHNWVRVMRENMPQDVPRREEAIVLIEGALRHVGFTIQ